ncbi:MAG: hypothetical protein PHR45_07105 [Muribaculaceae bacterium]|nr:hypothetical protein [Muribaculaceae bacterium]
MGNKTQRNKTLLIIVLLIIAFLGIIYLIVYKTGIYNQKSAIKDSTELAIDTVAAKDNILLKDSIISISRDKVGFISLGDYTHDVVKKLSKDYQISKQSDGPELADVIYVVKKNGKPLISLRSNSRGFINDIFVFDSHFRTKDNFGVGSMFRDLIAKYKNADMRFGDLNDGVNTVGSGEMFKAGGVLFLHYVEESSTLLISDYNYDAMTFEIKDKNTDTTVDAILVSQSIW